MGHFFSSIFDNSRKINGQAFSVTFALRLYKSYNHADEPHQQMWLSQGPWPDSKCSKTVKVRFHVKSCHWRNPREKNRECSNIKPGVSVHWWSQCQAKWHRCSLEFHHPAGIEPMSPDSLLLALTTKPWVSIDHNNPARKKSFEGCNMHRQRVI